MGMGDQISPLRDLLVMHPGVSRFGGWPATDSKGSSHGSELVCLNAATRARASACNDSDNRNPVAKRRARASSNCTSPAIAASIRMARSPVTGSPSALATIRPLLSSCSVTDYEHQARTGRGWARNVSRSASRSFTVIPGHAPWAERTSWASHRESTSSSRRTCSKDSTPRSYAVAASASSAARAGLASPRASSSEISSGISRTIFMRPAYTAPARLPMADFFQGHGEIKTRRRGDRGD